MLPTFDVLDNAENCRSISSNTPDPKVLFLNLT